MKTKKIIFLISALIMLFSSCTEQPYWEIPKDANGNAIITGVSKTTSTGITMLDPSFVVESYLPNAKTGDVMSAELVKPQVPAWDPAGAKQILPIANTKKQATVDASNKISVTYTRQEATLAVIGDNVTVEISGKTDSGELKNVTLKSAFNVTQSASAFAVKVEPVKSPYTGSVIAKYKVGVNGTLKDVTGSPFSGTQPYSIPMMGVSKDTVYYSFNAAVGSLTEEYKTSVVVK